MATQTTMRSSIRSGVQDVWPPTLDDTAYFGNDFSSQSWAEAVAALVEGDDSVMNAWTSIPNATATEEPPPMLVRASLDWLRSDARSIAPLRLKRVPIVESTVSPAGVGPSEDQDRPRITRVRQTWRATDRAAWWAMDMDVCFHRSGAMRGWCARLVVEMGRDRRGRGVAFRTFLAEPLGVIDEQALLLSS